MRSFCVSLPAADNPPKNVLVFLHGVGEAFIPVGAAEAKILYSAHPGELLKRPGLENLFNHGLPRILKRPGDVLCHDSKAGDDLPPFSHPVFKNFLTIIPQTLFREDLAVDEKNKKMMNVVCSIARAVTGVEANAALKIAVMGFSRGGFAALELGTRPEVSAIVTMDAVKKGEQPQPLGQIVAKHDKPVWAFFAEYPDDDKDRRPRITDVHRNLEVTEVSDFACAPAHKRCKTLVPTYGSPTDRHNQVCNAVSSSPAVYEWILNQLQAR